MKQILLPFLLLPFLIAGLTATKPAYAEEKAGFQAIPPILDPNFRHNKLHEIEISPYGGSYLGDTFNQTWIAGARGYFHFNNTFALGADYGLVEIDPNSASAFANNLKTKFTHILNAVTMFSNDAAFRVGKDLVEMDFYLSLGMGTMRINREWEPSGLVGGGVKFYIDQPWVAFRIDVNNYIHQTNWPGGSVLDFDVAFIGGISFLL